MKRPRLRRLCLRGGSGSRFAEFGITTNRAIWPGIVITVEPFRDLRLPLLDRPPKAGLPSEALVGASFVQLLAEPGLLIGESVAPNFRAQCWVDFVIRLVQPTPAHHLLGVEFHG